MERFVRYRESQAPEYQSPVKKILLVFLGALAPGARALLISIFLAGCASVYLPVYLQDKKPYTRRVYATYEEILQAVAKTLQDLGWEIDKTVDPLVYENHRMSDLDEQQILVLTKTRQTSMWIGSRYARMNIYLSSKKGISEIEIRYLTTTSILFRGFKSYRNDSAADRIFAHLEELLNQKAEKIK